MLLGIGIGFIIGANVGLIAFSFLTIGKKK